MLVLHDSGLLLQQALFVLGEGLLSDPAFSRDIAHAIDTLDLDNVILAFLGPAAGGAEFDVIRRECPEELKKRGLLDKLAFEWHSGDGFQQVCLHKVVNQVVQTLLCTTKERSPINLHTNNLHTVATTDEDVKVGIIDQVEPPMTSAVGVHPAADVDPAAVSVKID